MSNDLRRSLAKRIALGSRLTSSLLPSHVAVADSFSRIYMEDFLKHYGLLAVFLCALIENDVTFILAGAVCEWGTMEPVSAVAAGILGAIGHDSIWFAVGHRSSEAIRRSSVYQRVGPLVEGLAHRVGPWQLFIARFFYGTRNPSLLFWGVHRLSIAKFLGIELLALTVWGSMMTALGYFLSDRAMQIMGHVKKIEHLLLGGLAIFLLTYFIGRLFTRRAVKVAKKREENREPPEGPAE
jgi:membrane protein DedA with SNARE-associated domain